MRMVAAPTLRHLLLDVVACIVVCNVAKYLGVSPENGACLVAFFGGSIANDIGYCFEGYFNEWRNRK